MTRKHHTIEEHSTSAADPAPPDAPDAPERSRIARDLSTELGALPPCAGLDAIKANAAAGYYETAPPAALVADLESLAYETDEDKAVLGAIIERAKERAAAAS